MKHSLFVIIVIISACIIILITTILNDQVSKIGILKLNTYINEMNREESKIDYIGMISTFKLHVDLYHDTINQRALDKQELRVKMIISGHDNAVMLYDKDDFSSLSRGMLQIINFFRRLNSKEPLSLDAKKTGDDDLVIAYYYERNNYYERALAVYDNVLESGGYTRQKLPVILLHRGFCLALLRRTGEAKEQLTKVIKDYNNQIIGFTAVTLLQYIIFFENEIEKTKESDESKLAKSEKLYKLIAYNDAIEILDTIDMDDSAQKEKAQYIRARCYEESGDKEKAVVLYQEIIEGNGDSEAAKLSNSRLLIIGTMDENLEKLTELAIINNNEINDPEFDTMLEATEEYRENSENISETYLPDEVDESSSQTPEQEMVNEFITQTIDDKKKKASGAALTPEPSPVPAGTATPVPVKTKSPAGTATPVTAETKPPAATSTPVTIKTPPPDLDEVKKVNDDGSYSVFHNDEEGTCYKVEYYDDNGGLLYYIEYVYQHDGKIVGVVKKDPQGNIID